MLMLLYQATEKRSTMSTLQSILKNLLNKVNTEKTGYGFPAI